MRDAIAAYVDRPIKYRHLRQQMPEKLKPIITMENPIIQTDLAQVLNKLDSKIDKLDEKIDKLATGQVEIKGDIKALDERLSGQIKALDERLSGDIKALDTKTEQLNIRVANVEFSTRAIVIGVVVTVLGGAAMFVYMFSKL